MQNFHSNTKLIRLGLEESGPYSVCSYYFVSYSFFKALFPFIDTISILIILNILLYFILVIHQFTQSCYSITREYSKVTLIFKILT